MLARKFAACAVIPVYNHERAIEAVLRGVLSAGLPVFLVDDGCGDVCAAQLRLLSEQPNVTLLRHTVNSGKGAAVLSGMRAAAEQGFTHALQIDADGQHTLADVARFAAAARSYPQAVICGHPIFDASIPKARYYGRYLTHAMVWLETLSFEIRDSMCGFRLYPLEAVTALMATAKIGSRMDFDTDILVRLHWRGVPTRWIATSVSYPTDGVSHFRMFFDNVRMTSLHVRLTLGMLVRSPVLLWRRIAARRADSNEMTR
ncbi:MAG TPA: glycosyltransferase family 2 protein [Steroidobacteraceae bacterium]|jgi:glycosyltransferase involved in cell wall biosynthesis